MTQQEIFNKVADTLVQALGVSRSEIAPETSLVGDLEAESIDFLDIVFRLEKEFGIEVARGELFPQEMLRDPALVSNGALTEAGAQALEGAVRVHVGGVLRQDRADQPAERILALARLGIAIGGEEALAHGVDVLAAVSQQLAQVRREARRANGIGRLNGHACSFYSGVSRLS